MTPQQGARGHDRRDRGGERGFTLVELIVAVTVLGVVIAPLSASIVLAIRSTVATQDRFTESRGAQIAAAYFPNDVQSAATVTVDDAAPCDAASGAAVVSFRWSDDVSASHTVSYAVRDTGDEQQLVRRSCTGTSAPVTVVVVHGLSTPVPGVTCSPGCSAPRTVTLQVTAGDGYSFEIEGTRRSA